MGETKISGATYRVVPLLATNALILQAKLLKVLGTAVERLPELLKARKEGDIEGVSAAAVAAFTDIFSRAEPEAMAGLLKEIAQVAERQSTSKAWDPVDIDSDFTGDLTGLFELIIFVLREQFGNFFSDLLDRGRRELNKEGSLGTKSSE